MHPLGTTTRLHDDIRQLAVHWLIGHWVRHWVIMSLLDRMSEGQMSKWANGQKHQRCVIFVDKENIINQRRNRKNIKNWHYPCAAKQKMKNAMEVLTTNL
jgi:hypothetical protein